jgi:hypothetical protein
VTRYHMDIGARTITKPGKQCYVELMWSKPRRRLWFRQQENTWLCSSSCRPCKTAIRVSQNAFHSVMHNAAATRTHREV